MSTVAGVRPAEKKLLIRMPIDFHAELVRLAEKDTRSLNGELLVLLREAIATRNGKHAERCHAAERGATT